VTTSHPDNQARHLVARSDRGYVAEPTAEALATCIEMALADLAPLSEPAESWIAEFGWSAVADEYARALAGVRRPARLSAFQS
jgi:hypothetical protein